MKQLIILTLLLFSTTLFAQYPEGKTVLDKIDENMSSENRVFTARMIIHGKRSSRTMELKSWSVGDDQSFSEYLSPARDAGTKMLKLEDKLWIYSPSTDRTIQISGHMLRQSVMGSDLSYEDMMEDVKLSEQYHSVVTGTEEIEGRNCYILELTATDKEVSYYKRILWVDIERYIPLKEELYSKSDKLLKKTELFDVVKLKGRWFPRKIVFKDMLKSGKGTEYIIDDIELDVKIPEHIFSKASLKE